MQEERIAHRAMQRRRYADLGAEIDHAAREPLQLQRPALLEIVMHRGGHVWMQRVRKREPLVGEIVRDRHAVSAADRGHLAHEIEEKLSGQRIRAHWSERLAGRAVTAAMLARKMNFCQISRRTSELISA